MALGVSSCEFYDFQLPVVNQKRNLAAIGRPFFVHHIIIDQSPWTCQSGSCHFDNGSFADSQDQSVRISQDLSDWIMSQWAIFLHGQSFIILQLFCVISRARNFVVVLFLNVLFSRRQILHLCTLDLLVELICNI